MLMEWTRIVFTQRVMAMIPRSSQSVLCMSNVSAMMRVHHQRHMYLLCHTPHATHHDKRQDCTLNHVKARQREMPALPMTTNLLLQCRTRRTAVAVVRQWRPVALHTRVSIMRVGRTGPMHHQQPSLHHSSPTCAILGAA